MKAQILGVILLVVVGNSQPDTCVYDAYSVFGTTCSTSNAFERVESFSMGWLHYELFCNVNSDGYILDRIPMNCYWTVRVMIEGDYGSEKPVPYPYIDFIQPLTLWREPSQTGNGFDIEIKVAIPTEIDVAIPTEIEVAIPTEIEIVTPG